MLENREREHPLACVCAIMSGRGRGGGGGLQHLSKIVLDKVRQKAKTTYNELADEMVGELCHPRSGP